MRRHDRILVMIAAFRLVKAVMLVFAGIAALELLSPRVAATAHAWLNALPFAAEHQFVRTTATKILSASPNRKELAAAVAFAYAALFATEGVGLWLEKRWAEYLTIIATASFIPFEVYEVMKRVSALRVAVLIANALIVGYLVVRVRRGPGPTHEKAGHVAVSRSPNIPEP
ncbi:MAG TPA: DUF2127 domain-containing protein [Thermoanaerobaculia bacterium]|nr:DUF2127 domain-containing protein [Thermoanaerobaculia bacterium]